ncbi:MAG: CoB--CoM heterodisulfide reductase iron-sulfur subunit B family protein [bacterium]
MKYLYYPGCSASGTGRAYQDSLLPVFETLGIQLEELKDWNCCGATAYIAINEAKAFALSARNLALAEDQFANEPEINVVAPCNACYLGLLKAKHYIEDVPRIKKTIRSALQAAQLDYKGKVHVRHPLDILVNDYGIDKIKKHIKKPLAGMKIATYYGCQIVRPYAEFDDVDNPITMDQVLMAAGAEIVDWEQKTRCCGGMITPMSGKAGHKLNYILLKEAKKYGADVIATCCPLCQFNLECFQDKINSTYKTDLKIPVAYFTQLLGFGLGIDESKLGFNKVFVPPKLPVTA